MYPLMPVEAMAGALQFVLVFFTLLAAVLGCVFARS